MMKHQKMSKRVWLGAGILALAVGTLGICVMRNPVVKAEKSDSAVGELVELQSGRFVFQADLEHQNKDTYTIPVYAADGETQLGWYQHYVNYETGAAVDNLYAWEKENASIDLTDAKAQVERMNANALATMEAVGNHGEKGYAKWSDMDCSVVSSDEEGVKYDTIPIYGEDRKTMVDVMTRITVTAAEGDYSCVNVYYPPFTMTEEEMVAEVEQKLAEMIPEEEDSEQ